MDAAPTCPRCGISLRTAGEAAGDPGPAAVRALTREVERLRRVAEDGGGRRSAEAELVESLTREVRALRETVARLRGSSILAIPPSLPAP
ncbi:MAG: hypothetical protein ACRDPT_04810 [Streptomycetales bacterium]